MREDLGVERYPFTIRPMTADEGTGCLIEFPDLPGSISDGLTPEQAVQNGRDAALSYLLSCEEFGDPIPAPGSRSVMPVPTELRARIDERARKQHLDPGSLAEKLLMAGLDAEDPAA